MLHKILDSLQQKYNNMANEIGKAMHLLICNTELCFITSNILQDGIIIQNYQNKTLWKVVYNMKMVISLYSEPEAEQSVLNSPRADQLRRCEAVHAVTSPRTPINIFPPKYCLQRSRMYGNVNQNSCQHCMKYGVTSTYLSYNFIHYNYMCVVITNTQI